VIKRCMAVAPVKRRPRLAQDGRVEGHCNAIRRLHQLARHIPRIQLRIPSSERRGVDRGTQHIGLIDAIGLTFHLVSSCSRSATSAGANGRSRRLRRSADWWRWIRACVLIARRSCPCLRA
jgi:hypothetical protein